MDKPYRTKPFYLQWLTTQDVWVTFYPWINVPPGLDPASRPEICIHENVHLVHQASIGRFTWLWKYFTDRSFRLLEECSGIAAEVLALPPDQQNDRIKRYAYQLTTSMYRKASPNPDAAEESIRAAIAHRQGLP